MKLVYLFTRNIAHVGDLLSAMVYADSIAEAKQILAEYTNVNKEDEYTLEEIGSVHGAYINSGLMDPDLQE